LFLLAYFAPYPPNPRTLERYRNTAVTQDKTAAGVAKCMAQLMGVIGFAKIIQCNNGNEFKRELLILSKQHGIKIINGRPRYLQSQGLVEQANGVMKKTLWYWLAEHKGQGWSDAFPEIALAMNRQGHKSLGERMPYEVFFGRKPRWEDPAGKNLRKMKMNMWNLKLKKQ